MRFNQLDLLRTLCSFLVVLIHTDTPLSNYYIPATRCAVPVFFILSGFVMYQRQQNRIAKGIQHILCLIVISSAVFCMVKVGISTLKNDWEWVSFKSIFDLLVYNENPFATHLWYLSAYLYVLIIYYLMIKINVQITKFWPI